MKVSLCLVLSFLVSSAGLSFDKSECRDCTPEVKDQVADIRKQFKLSKKADVVVLPSGEEGAKELKEIVDGDKIDNTDLVMVPIEGEPEQDGKKKTEGYVVVVKGISKKLIGLLGAYVGYHAGAKMRSFIITQENYSKIPHFFGKVFLTNKILVPGFTITGVLAGHYIGKKFGKWSLGEIPKPIEEAKKPAEQQPTPSSSDVPASN